MAVPFKPEGYHTITPYLVVEDAEILIRFIQDAFDGKEIMRLNGPNNSIMHAEMQIGDSRLMLATAQEGFEANNAMLYLYLNDVDAYYEKAIKAGGKGLRPPEDQFYGDRTASVAGPQGNHWSLGAQIEDISPEELQKRMEAMG